MSDRDDGMLFIRINQSSHKFEHQLNVTGYDSRSPMEVHG